MGLKGGDGLSGVVGPAVVVAGMTHLGGHLGILFQRPLPVIVHEAPQAPAGFMVPGDIPFSSRPVLGRH
jgi:hypothetical protein